MPDDRPATSATLAARAPCAAEDGSLPEDCPGWCEYADPPPAPSDRIGLFGSGCVIDDRYELGDLIGEGGMAHVFRAFDRKCERTVAVKLMRRRLARSAAHTGRFLTEGRAMARIDHRNVVAVHDCGIERGVPYLVMEHVDGASLESVLADSPQHRLEIRAALRVLIAICDAVDELHARGVVHNDIKTSNVFIEPDGNAKVGDFGMARPLAPCCRNPKNTVAGTPNCMAPELPLGTALRPARSADVYSLGVLAYRLLSGRMPFRGRRPGNLVAQQLAERPRRLSSLRRSLEGPLEEVILAALSRHPERRPVSASAFALLLRRELANRH